VAHDPATAAVAAVAAGLEEEFAAGLEPVEEAEVFDDEPLIGADEEEHEDVRAAAPAPEPRAPRRHPDEGRGYDYPDGGDRRSVGLLRRIASGLSRRDEDEEDFAEVEPRSRRRGAPQQARLTAPERRRLPAPDADEYMDDVADEAPKPRRAARPAPKAESAQRRPRVDAEPASRARPAPRPADDDQLEIPAFLRRQAN
jgi:cell division protein FtsZ